ncbi:MAG: leucine--tRNA ligase, partial [Clostridia bacterium]|nr:leucine--tRNA ligase [Clostridia bacterium]
ITAYAQRLIDDLALVDYPDRVRAQQINWIGRSTGAQVTFNTTAGEPVVVYTTRPDTLFGATYMVVSPEHPLIETWIENGNLHNVEEIRAYQEAAARKSDFERTEVAKDKSGVCLEGVTAINPVNGREIPIFISDYVLVSYGTGAIMAVPAHDTRDWEFAKKFNLPIIEVVKGGDVEKEAFTDCATGIMVNSGFLDGLSVEEAKKAIIDYLTKEGIGEQKVNYKLRDWVFSRQRYWGEPIPIVHCPHCGQVAVPEEQLPIRLPKVDSYEPTDNGESPLAAIDEWVNTTCPKCGAPAKRETDTMPQWAGSSWYFLRYCDPHNDQALASKEALNYWLPINWYNGGMEHTTLHLLYSRFWHKFLYDIGVAPTAEPYAKRTSHGMILGENGEKMSKSRGNVVNPDEIVAEFGADTLRLYEMFIGDFEKAAPWSSSSIRGSQRFLERVWALFESVKDGDTVRPELEISINRTIRKVGEDIENLKFNTAIAAMMALVNDMNAAGGPNRAEYAVLVQLLNPFAPHMTEELWKQLGNETDLAYTPWPTYDPDKCTADTVEIAVQVNGKIRARMNVGMNDDAATVLAQAKENEKIAPELVGKQIVKELYVPQKLVNLVVKPL